LPAPQQVAELARTLEVEACTSRLLGHLFPQDHAGLQRPGRLRTLEELIDGDPALRQALLDDDPRAIDQAWSSCLYERGHDVRLHHTLAVLYREKALDRIARTGTAGEILVRATALWVLLLATEEFWSRSADRDAEGRLREKVARELLFLNASEGAQSLAAGDVEAARRHLRCLDACRGDATALTDVLADSGLLFLHPVDERLTEISTVAEQVLDGWCTDVIEAARRKADDPAAISRLPDGIRMDYASGIAILAPFIRLDVPILRVLRTGLEWHVDWCFGLYHREEHGKIEDVLESAREFADRLAALCTRGQGHRPENQALSRFFLLHGFVNNGTAQATRDYEESLEWNPANANATELLLEGDNAAHMRTARQALGRAEYTQALKAIQQIAADSQFAEPARQIQLEALLLRSAVAVEAGDFDKATTNLETALAVSPSPEERTFLAERISMVFNARAVALANEAQRKYGPYDRSRRQDDLLQALHYLSQALEHHPDNDIAAKNATAVKSMLRQL
jgi:tetratricopeptide (TPR) repeat protein